MNNGLFYFLSLCIPFCIHSTETLIQHQEHEIWWENALGECATFDTFESWLGDENAPSRSAMRRTVLEKDYRSILDIPCGICMDYYGLKSHGINIQYLGMDITPKLIRLAEQQEIPAVLGSIESIPLSDSSFDLVYARHILEHLSGYELALNELVRVAKREVLIVFFIKPNDSEEDEIKAPLIDGYPIYHNCYSRSRLEERLKAYQKVTSWTWETVSANEEILHLYCH